MRQTLLRAPGALIWTCVMSIAAAILVAPVQAQAPNVPAKLLELETIAPPTTPSSANWQVAPEATTLYTSGDDSARVYFGRTGGTDRVILAKVSGRYYVRAGVFGWFEVTSATLAEYNAIQRAVTEEYNYLNFHPFERAFSVAALRDGPGVLPPGAELPRAIRPQP